MLPLHPRIMLALAFAGLLCAFSLTSHAADAVPPGWTDVRSAGAKGDGRADDTQAIGRAIARTPDGGIVFFPPGKYRVTGEIVVNRPVSFAGTGRGSQIYQASQKASLFVLQGVRGTSFRDLYLGSAATVEPASLIKLVHSHQNRFDNVMMLGSYYGIHLQGSLLNSFVNLSTGTNVGGFFGNIIATNQAWVIAERFEPHSANANTFIAPVLEGGTNGMRIEDEQCEGSVVVLGGTIEGVSEVGISIARVSHASLISGVHFEDNGKADIAVDHSSQVRIESVFATGTLLIGDTAINTTVASSMIGRIDIAATAVRTRLDGVMTMADVPNPINDAAKDTQYASVSSINPFDFYGTLGIGVVNPSSNPQGLTPDLRLDVNGKIRAKQIVAGGIVLGQGEQELGRVVEDAQGLHLEDVATGERSRIMLERDVEPLLARLQALEKGIEELRSRPVSSPP